MRESDRFRLYFRSRCSKFVRILRVGEEINENNNEEVTASYLLTFRKTESSNRMTDRIRSRWLLVVDESVSSDDVSFFCCSMIESFLLMLELFAEWRIGLTRAWIKGRSGDSSANGMFSPKVNGRLMGCCRCDILLTTDRRGLAI